MITSTAERHELVTKLEAWMKEDTDALVRSEEGGAERRGRIAAYRKVIDDVMPKVTDVPPPQADYGFGSPLPNGYA